MTDQASSLAANVALNTGKAAPALSATTETATLAPSGPPLSASGAEPILPAATETVVDATALDADNTTVTEPLKTDVKVEPKADEPKPEPKKDDTPPAIKAEITKERNRRREAEDRAAAAESKADEANRRAMEALEAVKALVPKTPDPSEAPRPNKTQFDDPDAYVAAVEKWTADRTAAAVRAEEQGKFEAKTAEEKAAAAKKVQEDQTRAVIDTYQARRTQALDEFPDFAEVAEADSVQISLPMSHVILTAENGPAIAYHLGKNPEEAARIAVLPPVQAAFEMGKLAIRMEEAGKKHVSAAPPPPKHIGQGNAATEKSLAEMSMDEYAAKRQPQIDASRQPAYLPARH